MTARLASAGAEALNDYAALAMTRGKDGMLLAVAVLARIDAMDKSGRQSVNFSRQALAQAVAGQIMREPLGLSRPFAIVSQVPLF